MLLILIAFVRRQVRLELQQGTDRYTSPIVFVFLNDSILYNEDMFGSDFEVVKITFVMFSVTETTPNARLTQ